MISGAPAPHPGLSREELLFNYPYGEAGGSATRAPRSAVPRPTGRRSLWAALCAEIEAAVDDRPVYVEFSGGCDSSVVLAAAAAVCRRVGHADPVPVTFRFPEYPETDESTFQNGVVEALGLTTWQLFQSPDMELLGAPALAAQESLGLAWPPQVFTRAAIWGQLEPGVLLTGEGGDEVFGPPLINPLRSFASAARRRDVVAAARAARLAVMGPSQRAQFIVSSNPLGWEVPWLSTELRREVFALAAQEAAQEPIRRASWARWYLRAPSVHRMESNLRWFGASFGLDVRCPLMAPGVVWAAVDALPPYRRRNRTELLHAAFADTVPGVARSRTSKIHLTRPFFGRSTKAFAAHWDGSGLPPGVDAAWLRHEWLTSDEPHAGSAMLLLVAAQGSRSD